MSFLSISPRSPVYFLSEWRTWSQPFVTSPESPNNQEVHAGHFRHALSVPNPGNDENMLIQGDIWSKRGAQWNRHQIEAPRQNRHKDHHYRSNKGDTTPLWWEGGPRRGKCRIVLGLRRRRSLYLSGINEDSSLRWRAIEPSSCVLAWFRCCTHRYDEKGVARPLIPFPGRAGLISSLCFIGSSRNYAGSGVFVFRIVFWRDRSKWMLLYNIMHHLKAYQVCKYEMWIFV